MNNNISDKEFIVQAKRILKRVPGTHALNNLRHQIIRIRELSDLIKDKKCVVFPDYSIMETNLGLSRSIAHEILAEWLDLYGVVYLRKNRTTVPDSQMKIILWNPMALLEIPPSHEEYLKGVERETRRTIRQAEKQGYEFFEFPWNDHLDEIYDINTSTEIRQSVPMRGWYRDHVKPRHYTEEELKNKKYYGAFKDGKLYAYFHFNICGDMAVGKHFIGHAQHLRFGIMNGLISYAVRECVNNPQIHWLNYGDWQGRGSLNAFKKHAGFQGYAILLNFDCDQEMLKYSARKVRTVWRL